MSPVTGIDAIIAGSFILAFLIALVLICAVVLAAIAVAGYIARRAEDQAAALDDDSTGCEIGDDAIAMVAELGDAEIEQWVSEWKRQGRG